MSGTWAQYQNIDMCGQGDVELIKDWRSKYSLEDLKHKVEENNWSAISIGEFGFAVLKNFDYNLEPSRCKPTMGYKNTLYIYTPPPALDKKSQKIEEDNLWAMLSGGGTISGGGGSWTRFENIDMYDQGDVDLIQDWRSKMSLEDLLRKVEENDWSAVSIGDFDFAVLKSFAYQLQPSHCRPSRGYRNTLYIFIRPPTCCSCSIS